MGPKVEAALRFLRAGGREAIVTVSDRLVDAVRGRAGTHVTPAGRARPAVEEPTALARSAARYTVIRGARRPVIGSADIDRAGAHVGKVIH